MWGWAPPQKKEHESSHKPFPFHTVLQSNARAERQPEIEKENRHPPTKNKFKKQATRERERPKGKTGLWERRKKGIRDEISNWKNGIAKRQRLSRARPTFAKAGSARPIWWKEVGKKGEENRRKRRIRKGEARFCKAMLKNPPKGHLWTQSHSPHSQRQVRQGQIWPKACICETDFCKTSAKPGFKHGLAEGRPSKPTQAKADLAKDGQNPRNKNELVLGSTQSRRTTNNKMIYKTRVLSAILPSKWRSAKPMKKKWSILELKNVLST